MRNGGSAELRQPLGLGQILGAAQAIVTPQADQKHEQGRPVQPVGHHKLQTHGLDFLLQVVQIGEKHQLAEELGDVLRVCWMSGR